ncbi:hypothetical protein RHGRI_026105 [Rhododendron griersonianum]|uniref:beta-galactosidase n=1 Tax=Rhododendron griersonianum TaxID=479676 RepID=A0AAV6IV17_9ERIC|nr:hypothetical protein RHGRI_026105 [Rhododendron griersonianum]
MVGARGISLQCLAVGLTLHVAVIAGEFFKPFNVSYDHRALIIDGKRRMLISAGIHYPRATPQIYDDEGVGDGGSGDGGWELGHGGSGHGCRRRAARRRRSAPRRAGEEEEEQAASMRCDGEEEEEQAASRRCDGDGRWVAMATRSLSLFVLKLWGGGGDGRWVAMFVAVRSEIVGERRRWESHNTLEALCHLLHPTCTPGHRVTSDLSEMWPDLIAKSKEGGADVIQTYAFWSGHEPVRGQYNFEGRYDIVKFVKLVGSSGLYLHLRIGPYVCAEWNFGGFPVWLRDVPGIEFRTENAPFKEEMLRFVTMIVDLMREEMLFSWQGGPIIMLQIENEYGNVEGSYGQEGKEYVKWAAKMAVGLRAGVPWVMCKQVDAPEDIVTSSCLTFHISVYCYGDSEVSNIRSYQQN